MAEKKTLSEKAKEILEQAEQAGVKANFLFTTTFHTYIKQIEYLRKLEKNIEDEGMLVSKEYVRGRKNLYVSPALSAYNKTVDSANKTANSLMRIIRDGQMGDTSEIDRDPLFDIINNSGDIDE